MEQLRHNKRRIPQQISKSIGTSRLPSRKYLEVHMLHMYLYLYSRIMNSCDMMHVYIPSDIWRYSTQCHFCVGHCQHMPRFSMPHHAAHMQPGQIQCVLPQSGNRQHLTYGKLFILFLAFSLRKVNKLESLN